MKIPSTRAWLVVALLWPVALLNYLDRLMITTMREPLVAEIGISDAQFGLLTSVFLWVYAILSPAAGYLADRYGRRIVILGSLAVWSAVTWATGQANGFAGLLTARGLMGISEACYIPASLALIADYHRGPTRSLATGLHTSGIYAGAALGGLGGIVAERYGWRSAFTLFGGIGLAYSVVLVFGLRDHPRSDGTALETELFEEPAAKGDRPALGETFDALAAERGFWLLALVNVLVGASNWILYAWLPTYLRDRFSLGVGAAGLSATGYLQVASFVGTLAGGAWSDAWCRTRPQARAWVPALGYLAAGPCLLMAATTSALAVAILGVMVVGLGRGFFDANHMPLLRQWIAPRYSATGYGALNMVSSFSGGVMVYAGGLLRGANIGLASVFQAAAAGLLVSGILLFLMPALSGRMIVEKTS